MEISDVVRELKLLYKDGVKYQDLDRHLTEGDVQRWSVACGWSRLQLFDAIAKCLGLGFDASDFHLSFAMRW